MSFRLQSNIVVAIVVYACGITGQINLSTLDFRELHFIHTIMIMHIPAHASLSPPASLSPLSSLPLTDRDHEWHNFVVKQAFYDHHLLSGISNQTSIASRGQSVLYSDVCAVTCWLVFNLTFRLVLSLNNEFEEFERYVHIVYPPVHTIQDS